MSYFFTFTFEFLLCNEDLTFHLIVPSFVFCRIKTIFVPIRMLQFFKHTMLWLTALSILNSSIDITESPFATHYAGVADDVYEEIESIAEFLLDETFDQTLPDQTGNDEQGLLKKSTTFDFSLPERKVRIHINYYLNNHSRLCGDNNHADLPAGYTTIVTPPPDLA
jgi:hypothetical protein